MIKLIKELLTPDEFAGFCKGGIIEAAAKNDKDKVQDLSELWYESQNLEGSRWSTPSIKDAREQNDDSLRKDLSRAYKIANERYFMINDLEEQLAAKDAQIEKLKLLLTNKV